MEGSKRNPPMELSGGIAYDQCAQQSTATEMEAKRQSDLPFDACSQEEKVRRLAWEVRNLQETLQWVISSANEAKDVALQHAHHPGSGEVFVPANRRGNNQPAMTGRINRLL